MYIYIYIYIDVYILETTGPIQADAEVVAPDYTLLPPSEATGLW